MKNTKDNLIKVPRKLLLYTHNVKFDGKKEKKLQSSRKVKSKIDQISSEIFLAPTERKFFEYLTYTNEVE